MTSCSGDCFWGVPLGFFSRSFPNGFQWLYQTMTYFHGSGYERSRNNHVEDIGRLQLHREGQRSRLEEQVPNPLGQQIPNKLVS
jgi:hypothetical protein